MGLGRPWRGMGLRLPSPTIGPEECIAVHLAVITVMLGPYGHAKKWHNLQPSGPTVQPYAKRKYKG